MGLSAFFEDEHVVVLVVVSEVVAGDEVQAFAFDFGADDFGVDAVIGAGAGVVDDAETATVLEGEAENGEQEWRMGDFVVNAQHEGGVEGVGGERGSGGGAEDG